MTSDFYAILTVGAALAGLNIALNRQVNARIDRLAARVAKVEDAMHALAERVARLEGALSFLLPRSGADSSPRPDEVQPRIPSSVRR